MGPYVLGLAVSAGLSSELVPALGIPPGKPGFTFLVALGLVLGVLISGGGKRAGL